MAGGPEDAGGPGDDRDGAWPPKAATPAPDAPRARSTPAASAAPARASSFASAADASSLTSPTKLYMPQFTATTQMILNRIKHEAAGGFNSALASAAATTARGAIQSATYDDVRRRLLSGMSTSSTMQMPTPAAAPVPSLMSSPKPAASAAKASTGGAPATPPIGRSPGKSAIQRVNAGPVTKRPRGRPPKVATSSPAGAADGRATGSASKKARTAMGAGGGGAARGGARALAGVKRKRGTLDMGRASDSDSEGSPLSEPEEGPDAAEAGNGGPVNAPLTTTKSGRQVLKPLTYNPAAMELSHSRRRQQQRQHGGDSAVPVAMCRLCSRLAYTPTNQLVFCDGCDEAWHQACHDPPIDPAFALDPKREWHCDACAAKSEKPQASQQSKRSKTVHTPAAASPAAQAQNARVSWAGRTPGQKRAYLSGLSHPELVELLMRCAELQPSLPIFPSEDSGMGGADVGPNGPINFIRKVSSATPSTPGGTTTTGLHLSFSAGEPSTPGGGGARVKEELDDGTWDDPTGLLEAWKRPRPGGPPVGRFAAQLQLLEASNASHLEDPADSGSFSHTVYDGRGHKVEMSGIPV